MFVMTKTFGDKYRNDLRYSHASITKYSLLPAMKFVRLPAVSFIKLPTITVGFSPASIKIFATIAVVVVLPCVPVIAIVHLSFEITPSASGYDMTGIPRFFASANSVWSFGIAIV